MSNVFFIFIAISFLFINFYILKSDLKNEIIPNKYLKYLIYLLPLWYIFLYIYPLGEFNIISFIIQIIISLFVSFSLFHYGFRQAGDAKYLLVLSLYIPYIGIVSLIGNLGLLTLTYLFGYFIRFFIGKSIINKEYSKQLYSNIKIDLSEKWRINKKNKGKSTINIIVSWISTFLIIFVSIKITKIYIISYINSPINIKVLQLIIEKYHFYLLILLIFIIYFIYILYKKINNFLKIKISSQKTKTYIKYISLTVLLGLLIAFIVYEYHLDSQKTKYNLVRILTFYIFLWFFFKIIFYGYKLSFGNASSYLIDLHLLNENHIVDKDWVNQLFHFRYQKGEEGFLLLYNNAFNKNKINITEFKKLIRTLNEYEKRIVGLKKEDLTYSVKVKKTFSFGIYIFLGFIITFIFKNKIIIFLFNKLFKLLQQ